MDIYNKVRELFDYESVSGNLIRKISTNRLNVCVGQIAGTIDKDGYRIISIDHKKHKAHRLIWLWYYGVWPDHQIDHINGIRNDNRIENLREATANGLTDNQANHQNTGLQKNNKSGHSGVHWNKRRQEWGAGIMFKVKYIHFGWFKDFDLACNKVKEGKTKYHSFHPISR